MDPFEGFSTMQQPQPTPSMATRRGRSKSNYNNNSNSRNSRSNYNNNNNSMPSTIPLLRSSTSEADESVISFGSEFDRAFDQEVPSMSMDEHHAFVSSLLHTQSWTTTTNDNSNRSSRGVGGATTPCVLLAPTQSDLDQVFEELNELQETEDRFVAMKERRNFSRAGGSSGGPIHLYQYGSAMSGGGGGIYASSLGSLLENMSKDDLERISEVDVDGTDQSVRTESYYTSHNRNARNNVDDNKPPEDLLMRAVAHSTATARPTEPLSINSTWQNIPVKNQESEGNKKDDTLASAVSTQCTSPMTSICPCDGDDETRLSNLPQHDYESPDTDEILYDIDRFLEQVNQAGQVVTNTNENDEKESNNDEVDHESSIMETIVEEDYGESWDCTWQSVTEVKQSHDGIADIPRACMKDEITEKDGQRMPYVDTVSTATTESLSQSFSEESLISDALPISSVDFAKLSLGECRIAHAITTMYIKAAIEISQNTDTSPIAHVLETRNEYSDVISKSAQGMIRSNVPGIQFIGLSVLLGRSYVNRR
jgi:hypothetical protein